MGAGGPPRAVPTAREGERVGIGCVSRRTVLGATAAVGAVGLAGCGGTEWYPSDVTPDVYVLRAVVREKERMIARYEAAVAEGTGPVELLERFLEHHLSHLDALLESLPEDTPSPPLSPPAAPPPPRRPPSRRRRRGRRRCAYWRPRRPAPGWTRRAPSPTPRWRS